MFYLCSMTRLCHLSARTPIIRAPRSSCRMVREPWVARAPGAPMARGMARTASFGSCIGAIGAKMAPQTIEMMESALGEPRLRTRLDAVVRTRDIADRGSGGQPHWRQVRGARGSAAAGRRRHGSEMAPEPIEKAGFENGNRHEARRADRHRRPRPIRRLEPSTLRNTRGSPAGVIASLWKGPIREGGWRFARLSPSPLAATARPAAGSRRSAGGRRRGSR